MLRGLAWLIAVLPLSVLGQSQDSLIGPELIDEVSIATFSTKPSPVSGATQNIRVIQAKTIAEMGAQNLADVLQNQSGILISQDAQLGTGINLQGLSGQSIKILINGAPMGGRLNGNIDISQIPTNQIEQIEIIEGPMSVLFGSDAISGVINIITKKAYTEKTIAHIKSYVDGTHNTNFDVDISFPASHLRSGLQLNVGRQFFGGMDLDTFNRGYDWKPKTRIFGGFNYNTRSDFSQHLVRGNYFNESMLDRSNAEYNLISVTGYNNRFTTQRADLAWQTQTQFQMGKNFVSAKFNTSWNGFERRNALTRRNLVTGEETPSFIGETDTTTNHIFNARGFFEIHSRKKTPKEKYNRDNPTLQMPWEPKITRITTLLGYDANHESLNTSRIGANRNITDIGLFLQTDYKPNKNIQIQPSLRLNFNSRFGETILKETRNLKFTPVIPSVQTKFTHGKSVWRASYAKGYRAPTLKELYFLFVDINHNVKGNSNLQAEVAHNATISHRYQTYIKYSERGQIHVEAQTKIFYNRVNQQIQLSLLDPSNQLYQYINVGKLYSGGGGMDLTIGSRPHKLKQILLTVNPGIDFIQSQSQLNSNANWVGFSTIQGKFNVKLSKVRSGSSLQIFSRFSGQTQGFLANGDTYQILPYTLFDINASKEIKALGKHHPIQLQMGCKNLFNITQRTGTQTGGIHGSGGMLNISPGRAIFASITLSFQ
jgi:outer membrane receptor for ferrienterochelin and colicins